MCQKAPSSRWRSQAASTTFLPVSTRAIPVSYGLDAGLQIREGLKLAILNVAAVTVIGWLCLTYLPMFSEL